MSMDPVTFQGKISLIMAQYWTYPNLAAEVQAIITALDADPTTYDKTMQTPARGLIPGIAGQTPFTNEMLRIINIGKAGNLSNTAMADEINELLGNAVPPVNVDAPFIPGTASLGIMLTVTNGNWLNHPTSYTYQWRRGTATAIAGATAASYTIVAADVTAGAVNCLVTAVNGAGSTSHASNSVAVTALGG